jgi:hypothetical protein
VSRAPLEVKRSPKERHDIVDALAIGVHRHVVHALLEVDVTRIDHDVVTGVQRRGSGSTFESA